MSFLRQLQGLRFAWPAARRRKRTDGDFADFAQSDSDFGKSVKRRSDFAEVTRRKRFMRF